MLLLIALTLFGAVDNRPTNIDVDFARVDRIHQLFGDDGIVHCNRFRNLRCSVARRDRLIARCTYQEWAEAEPWPRKRIVLRRAGEDWLWVNGDAPQCQITIIGE
jgi:hypothetical protein